MEVQSEQKKLHRSPALDGFRGLGCLLVLFGHTQWTDGKTILPGAAIAMDLFFVLSGFLITGLLLKEFAKTNTIDLVTFWKRRAIRLLPVFYVYFGFGALVYLFSRFAPIVGTDPVVTLLSTAFYGSNWAMAKGYNMGIFAVTWSLSLEEQFYFLCPILFLCSLKFLNKKSVMLLLALSIVGVNVHRYVLFHEMIVTDGVALAFKRAFYGLDTRSDSLMIGCLASLFFNLYGHRFNVGIKSAGIAALIFFGSILIRDLPLAFHLEETSWYTEFLMTGGFTFFSFVGVTVILHLVQNPESFISRIFSAPFLVKIGLMSYSIYIWHTTIFGGLEILLKSMNQNPVLWGIKTVIRFSVAFGVGYLSFRFVELPILKLQHSKRKYSPLSEQDKKAQTNVSVAS